MKQITLKWFFYAVLSGVLMSACAGTQLTHSWVDESRRGKPVSDILVIGVTYKEKEAVRRSFEDRFVAQLRAVGIEAVSSEDAISIPTDLKLEKDDILKAVNKYNSDAVIITHVVGKENKEAYTPGARSYGGYYGYYGLIYGNTHGPGYTRTHTVVRLATNLYDVKTEKLIWSGTSETTDPGSTRQGIDDVINVLIKDMQKNGLISPK